MGVFSVYTIAAMMLAFSPSIMLYTIGCIVIGISAGIGNGVIFKLVPFYFNKQAGIANGIVSMMGGFFPPLLIAAIFSLTGQYSIGFILLSSVSLASLVLVVFMYYQDRLKLAQEVFKSTGQGIMVTNTAGTIVTVNPSFTQLTGFSEEEAIGQTPRILKSNRQEKAFYDEMWKSIQENGMWQGKIWNTQKNGEVFLEWLNISAVKDETGKMLDMLELLLI